LVQKKKTRKSHKSNTERGLKNQNQAAVSRGKKLLETNDTKGTDVPGQARFQKNTTPNKTKAKDASGKP